MKPIAAVVVGLQSFHMQLSRGPARRCQHTVPVLLYKLPPQQCTRRGHELSYLCLGSLRKTWGFTVCVDCVVEAAHVTQPQPYRSPRLPCWPLRSQRGLGNWQDN